VRRADLRAARANRGFGTDKNNPYQNHGYVQKQPWLRVALIQDRRLRADMLFIRPQSAIRADGFSSAQHLNSAITGGTT